MTPASDTRLGTTIDGRFILETVLGRGSGGVVYRARQRALDRDVAIKILAATDSRDPEARERFTREAKTVAQLTSPHTVALYDFGRTEDGAFYTVMELVEGETLDARLTREGAVPAADCIAIFKGIAASLEEAHERGIVHRDIKPANVIIQASDGRARVLDFGISKLLHQRISWTQDGDLLGTPPYMAPELWADDHGEVCAATDVYAVGVMLHQLLAGALPFRGATVAQMMKAHLSDQPQPLPASVQGRDHFDAVIQRCLVKSPSGRFLSAAAFAQALDAPDEPARSRGARYGLAGAAGAFVVVAALRFSSSTSAISAQPDDSIAAHRPTVLVGTATKAEVPPTPVRAPPRRRRRPSFVAVEAVGVDMESARRIVERAGPVLQRCGGVRGDEQVRLMVAPQGTISRVKSTTDNVTRDGCALEGLRALRFPPLRGQFAVVTLQRAR